MEALINKLNSTKCKLELLALLKQKIEESIIEEKAIIVSALNSFMSCRNKIYIEDYEIDEERLYLSDNNFEIYINPNELKEIKYDNFEECLTIIHNNTEISLCF